MHTKIKFQDLFRVFEICINFCFCTDGCRLAAFLKTFKLKRIRNTVIVFPSRSKLSGNHFVSISFTECFEGILQFNMTQTPELTRTFVIFFWSKH